MFLLEEIQNINFNKGIKKNWKSVIMKFPVTEREIDK